VRGRDGVLACLLAGALAVSGCGGGSRADSGEPNAKFDVQVVKASFPTAQAIARQEKLEIELKNTGSKAVPNVAVTLDSLSYRSNYPGLADPRRPVWVVEQGPGAIAKPPVESQEVSPGGSGQTSYTNTWALGRLAAGQTRTFVWHVVPVKSGRRVVHYSVAAGLAGKARAQTSSGTPVTGTLSADIAAAPPRTHVDPATGAVVTGTFNGVP
jgi:hypothetical protein